MKNILDLRDVIRQNELTCCPLAKDISADIIPVEVYGEITEKCGGASAPVTFGVTTVVSVVSHMPMI